MIVIFYHKTSIWVLQANASSLFMPHLSNAVEPETGLRNQYTIKVNTKQVLSWRKSNLVDYRHFESLETLKQNKRIIP